MQYIAHAFTRNISLYMCICMYVYLYVCILFIYYLYLIQVLVPLLKINIKLNFPFFSTTLIARILMIILSDSGKFSIR